MRRPPAAAAGEPVPGLARRGSVGMQTRKSTKRQAMLTLSRLEPWSVMKFSFVASVVAFIILFVAVAVLYMVLSALGVFESLQHTVSSITSSQSSAGHEHLEAGSPRRSSWAAPPCSAR